MHNFSGLFSVPRNLVYFCSLLCSFRFCTITAAIFVFFSLVLATEPKYSACVFLLKFRDCSDTHEFSIYPLLIDVNFNYIVERFSSVSSSIYPYFRPFQFPLY
jgi:hypothetical protein